MVNLLTLLCKHNMELSQCHPGSVPPPPPPLLEGKKILPPPLTFPTPGSPGS